MENNKNRRKENWFVRICPACRSEMKFYPGCCGNNPLWRCENCGVILKWQEKISESDKYLLLK